MAHTVIWSCSSQHHSLNHTGLLGFLARERDRNATKNVWSTCTGQLVSCVQGLAVSIGQQSVFCACYLPKLSERRDYVPLVSLGLWRYLLTRSRTGAQRKGAWDCVLQSQLALWEGEEGCQAGEARRLRCSAGFLLALGGFRMSPYPTLWKKYCCLQLEAYFVETKSLANKY